MSESEGFQVRLEQAIEAKRQFLEEKTLPQLKESFRVFQSLFENLYNILLRKALVQEISWTRKKGNRSASGCPPFMLRLSSLTPTTNSASSSSIYRASGALSGWCSISTGRMLPRLLRMQLRQSWRRPSVRSVREATTYQQGSSPPPWPRCSPCLEPSWLSSRRL
jgi:hypothetical protein